MAQAYWWLADSKYKEASDKGAGMNFAMAYAQVCVQRFTEAKPYAEAAGGGYLSQFNTKF